MYVPKAGTLPEDVISYFHDSSHLGKDKIYNSVATYAYWSKQYEDVEKHVATCRECQSNKTANVKPAGQLQPLDVPDKCWEQVTADFVTKFPKSKRGHDTVLVMVDRLSKRATFIPTTE